MNFLNNFNISFSYSPYLLAIGIILIVLFSFYVYRTTLPAISIYYKIVLVILRVLGLSSILFLLFEPNITYKTKEIIEPTNLIYIDNSKSISQFASATDILELKRNTKSISEDLSGITEFYKLGKQTKQISIQQIDSLKFTEPSTNLSTILNIANKTKNLASIILFSDGIITEGKNPTSQIQNLGVPIYTIGIGDTSNKNDIKISKIKSNEFIYVGAKTKIEVNVKNTGFTNKKAIVKLIANNKIIEQKPIILSASEINRVSFNYKSEKSGEHKITAIVETNNYEKNKNNNVKSKIINIVDTKKKIFIISGSPNSDLSAITNSLKSNKDFDVESVVQIGTNKYYKNKSSLKSLQNADVLFLINFPTFETNSKMITEVVSIISSSNKPIFYCLSSNIDYNKLIYFETILPFKVRKKSNTYEQSQVVISNQSNNLLGNSEVIKNEWTKFAPVNITNSSMVPNISSDILLSSNNRNSRPILFTNNIANKKNIVLNAYNFWRWKLKAPIKEYNLFDNFIFNSVKWLSLNNDNDRFNVYLSKKSYKLGETIIFSASVFDETLQAYNNASIQLEVNNSKLVFNNVGNGQYECKVNIAKPGVYNYTAKLVANNKITKTITGKFNIEPVEIELAESKMNKELLVTLSSYTNGKFFSLSNSSELTAIINESYDKNIKVKFNDNQLKLSVLEAILFSIIFFFGLEWLIRKILKML